MDWDKLRIFHAVAEAGSFTHAGERLHLSQSAISRQISTLEDSIDVSLFHRHARGLILTEEGEILQQAAKDIFGKLAMIEGQIADARKDPTGPLRITLAGFVGETFLAPHIGDFTDHYPNIQLNLIQDNRIFNLSMREADAALRLYKPDQDDLVQDRLTTMSFQICASKDYIAKHGTPKDPSALKKHVLLGYPKDAVAPFTNANWLIDLAQMDVDHHNNILLLNSLYAQYRAVLSGAGIASLPRYMIADNPTIETILDDHERPGIDMYFVYPEERAQSQRLRVFQDFLMECVTKTSF